MAKSLKAGLMSCLHNFTFLEQMDIQTWIRCLICKNSSNVSMNQSSKTFLCACLQQMQVVLQYSSCWITFESGDLSWNICVDICIIGAKAVVNRIADALAQFKAMASQLSPWCSLCNSSTCICGGKKLFYLKISVTRH